ncbi:MAG: hypothetical protein ACXWUV_03885 [Allosphingosinicella sp.]
MGKNHPLKNPRAPQRVDARGGTYLQIPHCVVRSEAYRTASLRAKAVLSAIHLSFMGWNNGRLGVTMQEIGHRVGSLNNAANRSAIGELQARGLIAIEKVHPRGARKATEYRLTFVSTGTEKRPIPATHEYLNWLVGDAGTGKKRPQPIELRRDQRASTIEPEQEASDSNIEQRARARVGERPPARRSTVERHIGNHSEPVKPDCITDERWRAAATRAADNPAAPSADELRSRVGVHVDRFGRGAQRRLAAAAGIPETTFSRFFRGDAELSRAARLSLACAIPGVEAAEFQSGNAR